MRALPIDGLFTTSLPSPANSRDIDTQAVVTLWEAGDEAGFSIDVPPDYLPGSDLFLTMDEAQAPAGLSHSWTVKCLLARNSVGENLNLSETSVHSFVAETQEGSIVTRRMKVTGAVNPGTLDNRSILPGDRLGFFVKRSDDPSDAGSPTIRLFNISLEYADSRSGATERPGRLGQIVETVRDLFNEQDAGFLADDFILRSINRCQQDIAMEGYWRTRSWIPLQAGQDVIEMLACLPGYVDVYEVCYGPQRWPLKSLSSLKSLKRLKTVMDYQGTPEYYLIENNKLLIAPAPVHSLSQGLMLYHSYCPPDLSFHDTNPNPDIPRSFDQLFAYFALSQAFLKDRSAPGADVKFHEYNTLYQNHKNRLLAAAAPGSASLRPARR